MTGRLIHEQACRLFAFGRLIGNSDMHAGNIAFYHNGERRSHWRRSTTCCRWLWTPGQVAQ